MLIITRFETFIGVYISLHILSILLQSIVEYLKPAFNKDTTLDKHRPNMLAEKQQF